MDFLRENSAGLSEAYRIGKASHISEPNLQVRGANGAVEDMGLVLNPDTPASLYSSGLAGVDQEGNWLVSNVSVSTFFILLFFLIAYRGLHITKAELRQVVSLGRESDQRYWMQNHSHLWAKFKRQLMYAPLGRVRHNREFQLSSAITVGTLPGRLHALLLVLYTLSNLVYCFSLHWSLGTLAITAELRGRTGQLAALNLIPTVLFALRNNPLLWVTGVSYDTFNLFHRWAARIVVVESIVHTLCWAVNNLKSGGQDQVNLGLSSSVSFQGGMVATITFCVMLIAASSPLRHAFYETFVHSHRLFVLVALSGVYVHIDRARLPQLGYIQFIILLYAAELLIRYGRICYFNVSRKSGIAEITVEAMPSEACRVTFKLRRPWRYRPGCHIHVHMPTLALFSSHPFSVAWAESSDSSDVRMTVELEKIGTQSASPFTPMSAMPPVSKIKKSSPLSNDVALLQSRLVDRVSLVCRARAGFTRTLYDRAMRAQGKRFTTWGFLEGPYGGNESFASYGSVILFAGGVGITHCIGYIRSLLQQHQAGTCAVQRMVLVWSVPNTECLEWVRIWMDEILKMEGRRDVLKIQLFVTKPRHRGEVVSNTGSVQMFPGRCNPKLVIEKEMSRRIGATAVTVCGPGAFADSVRAAVRDVVEDGSVDFIEEAFTY